MICQLTDGNYCERHGRVHRGSELLLARDPSERGESYRLKWDAWKKLPPPTEEEKRRAAEKKAAEEREPAAAAAAMVQLKEKSQSRIAAGTKLVRCSPCSEKAGKDFFLKTGANMPVENALLLLNEPPGTLNPAWPATADAHRIEIGRQAEQAKKSTYPEGKFSGRGIVIAGGGVTYFGCAWVCASMLRWLGCKLPIELWFLGRGEMDSQMALLAKRLDITLVDAREVAKEYKPRILNGWELKPFAVLYSAFEEVMFLDADSIPVQNPEFMFDAPGFLDTGAVFWPDMAPYDRKEWLPPLVWERCGMEFRNYVDFESGQLMVNKRKCWDAMQLTLWMNYHSDYWYKIVFGDKSTWHLAWHKVERKYAMPEGACGWQWPAIIQRDFSGRDLFVHCVRGKGDLCTAQQMRVPLGEKMQDAGRVLSSLWQRKIWNHQDETIEEQTLRRFLAGKYSYTRVGLGERVLELLPDGSIGLGSAACEKRWTVRLLDGKPTIVVVGESHKGSEVGMMFLTEQDDGSWQGAWEFHERCGVILKRAVDLSLPSHWFFRPDSFDRDICDCIIRDNEYRLQPTFLASDIVVDIGAHIGSFSWAVLCRGAGRVLAVEPSSTNFSLLISNVVARSSRNFQAIRAALVPDSHDQSKPVFLNDVGLPNTGGSWISTEPGPQTTAVSALSIEQIFDLAAPGGKRIRLLKLDCEGGERVPLAEYQVFHRVDEIVAELHGKDATDLLELQKKIVQNLSSQGFTVQFYVDSGDAALGKLFASRANTQAQTRSKRALLQMAEGPHLRLLELAEARHLGYCQKHGLDYVTVRKNPLPELPASWGKIRLILDLFDQGYDQVVWMDTDVVIENTDENISTACASGIGMAWYDQPFQHFQAGVLVCNRSDEVIQLLNDILASAKLDANNDSSRAPLGMWEQTPLNVIGRSRNLITRISPAWNCVPKFHPSVRPIALASHGEPMEVRAKSILGAASGPLMISLEDRKLQLRQSRRFNDDDSWLPPDQADLSKRINSVDGLFDLLARTGPVLRVLEIGSFRGVSTEAFLLHGSTVVSVDPAHDNWRFDWLQSVYGSKLQLERMESFTYLTSGVKEKFDLIYLDGQHGYLDILSDIELSLLLLKPGGWLAGHDYNDVVPGGGVIRAVTEKLGKVETFSDTSWLFRVP